MDFEKLARYDGRLAAPGVPVLLVWGADDPFAPVAGAHRFQSELPEAELQVFDGAGHFVWEDEPEASAQGGQRLPRPARLEPQRCETWGHGAAVRSRGFTPQGRAVEEAELPLAARMRPESLGEFVGQEHLLGRGSALRTAIEEGARTR